MNSIASNQMNWNSCSDFFHIFITRVVYFSPFFLRFSFCISRFFIKVGLFSSSPVVYDGELFLVFHVVMSILGFGSRNAVSSRLSLLHAVLWALLYFGSGSDASKQTSYFLKNDLSQPDKKVFKMLLGMSTIILKVS